MADAFISYRRKPSAALAHLIQEKLKNNHGVDAYLDTTRTDSTRVQFPERLMQAIEDAPAFICLLAETTLESEWVRKEIQRAYDLRKHCIPVFQESYRPPAAPDPAVSYLLNFDGVHILEQRSIYIDESIAKLAALVPRRATWKRPLVWIAGAVVLLVAVGIVLNAGRWFGLSPDDANTPAGAARASTEVTSTAAFTLTPAPTQTHVPPTTTPTPTITSVPETPDSPEAFMALAHAGVTSNAAWTPFESVFDEVPVMLVPAGCFMMGSSQAHIDMLVNEFDARREVISDEIPQHGVCIDAPFWIDRYEVTNDLYGVAGCLERSSQPNEPRNCITWQAARDFCASRGMRLPTEAEWEYAARGPDSLVYPWGNDWESNIAMWGGVDPNHAVDVSSYPEGVSWVGAMNMAGNVGEWTSSLYLPHPYDSDHEDDDDDIRSRVVKGGSFGLNFFFLRASTRVQYSPIDDEINVGFRCVRSVS